MTLRKWTLPSMHTNYVLLDAVVQQHTVWKIQLRLKSNFSKLFKNYIFFFIFKSFIAASEWFYIVIFLYLKTFFFQNHLTLNFPARDTDISTLIRTIIAL